MKADQVLQAKVRDGAVVDDTQGFGRHVDPDVFDATFANGGISQQRRHGIEHRLQGRPDAPFLDRRAEDGVARAKLGNELLRRRIIGERGIDILAAAEGIVDG